MQKSRGLKCMHVVIVAILERQAFSGKIDFWHGAD